MTMLKAATIDFAAVSDVGKVRGENQDRWFADAELGLFLVADGLGGHAAGGLAAQIVAEVLPRLLKRRLQSGPHTPCAEAAEQISAALVELSEQLREESRSVPGLKGMGSTVVLALLRGRQAVVAHMGDSRAYLLHAGRLLQLTKDHTIAQLLVDHGKLAPEQAASHPARGRLTRYVGMGTEAIPETGRVRPGPRRPPPALQRRADGHAQRPANSGDPQRAAAGREGLPATDRSRQPDGRERQCHGLDRDSRQRRGVR